MSSSGYTLLDFGGGKRLEQWAEFRLIRPDPTASGAIQTPDLWKKSDAEYVGTKGKGEWHTQGTLPESWPVEFGDLSLLAHLTPYKHTGIFPEQEQNWNWMRERGKGRTLTALNLFAYTGGATVALARDGHSVTHVDAARPSIGMAKENAALNHLHEDAIRWILDDAKKFVDREARRGKTYDAVILDPPAYGHGPSGNTWRSERDLAPLLESIAALLSHEASFLVLNGYATHDTPESFTRLLTGILRTKSVHQNFRIDARDLALKTTDGRQLSTGTVARCLFTPRASS